MIEEGTLRDLTFEWGNMKARVALDEKQRSFRQRRRSASAKTTV